MRLVIIFAVLMFLGCSAGNSSKPPPEPTEPPAVIELNETATPETKPSNWRVFSSEAIYEIQKAINHRYGLMKSMCLEEDFYTGEPQHLANPLLIELNNKTIEIRGYLVTLCFMQKSSENPQLELIHMEEVEKFVELAVIRAVTEYEAAHAESRIPYIELQNAIVQVVRADLMSMDKYSSAQPVIAILILGSGLYVGKQI